MNLRYVTIATRDFLPAVCVLAESLRRHEPGATLACYLVGADTTAEEAAVLPFELRSADALPIPDARRFFFQYTAKELCCALKPHILADALQREPGSAAVFLDADIFVCAPFSDVFRAHLDTHALLITPHLLTPDAAPNVLTIMRAGIYNAGVVAVRSGADGDQVLKWWRERVARDCIRDPFGGLASDQRWLDLAVGLFDCVRPLRDPGVNVGHFNLHERKLAAGPAGITVNGSHPLRLYHFSGLTPRELSRFAPAELDQGDWTVANGLAVQYRGELTRWAASCPRPHEYAWDRFADGTIIEAGCREVVRRGVVETADPFQDRARVQAAVAADVLWQRATYWVERGPDDLERTRAQHYVASARAEIQRLHAHPAVGRVLRFWRRWVNPSL